MHQFTNWIGIHICSHMCYLRVVKNHLILYIPHMDIVDFQASYNLVLRN